MKTPTLKTLAMGITAVMILTTSCTKEGPVGPQGPAGINGTNGSSNVSSFTANTTTSSWGVNASHSYELDASFSVPAITADVVNNGTIQVFIGDGTGNQWSAMPFSLTGVEFNYTYSLQTIIFQVTQSNMNPPNNPGTQQFKIVVIPSAMRKAHPNVNYHNYEEVKKVFNLKD